MISGSAGSIEVWLWVMVCMAIVLGLIAIKGLWLAFKTVFSDGYQWRNSHTFRHILALSVLFAGLGIWYRIDSHSLWVARADAIDAVDYFIDAEDAPEILRIQVDDMPTFWSPNRPQSRLSGGTSKCTDTYPVSSGAFVSARQAHDLRPHFGNVKQLLEADGWDTIVPTRATAAPSDIEPNGVFLFAFRENKSILISVRNTEPGTTGFVVLANSTCREDIAPLHETN